jgi:hypothetical protein
MSSTSTPRLGLIKPTPGSGENVNVLSQLDDAWDKIDAAIGTTICTSSTRPASPYDGQVIRETDTRRMYVWNATQGAWDQIAIAGPSSIIVGSLNVNRALTTDAALTANVNTDTQKRLLVQADGVHIWGSGAASGDTNLYRGAANQLKTDDDFVAASLVTAGTVSSAGDILAGSGNGVNGFAVTSGSDTIAVGTYTNLAGTGSQTSFTFVKRFTSTRVRLSGSIGISAAAVGGAMLGATINGTDYDICVAVTASAARGSGSGARYIAGIPAGTYTVQGRWKRSAGSGTITRDVNDWLSIECQERN